MKIHPEIKTALESLPDGWWGDVLVTYQNGEPVTVKTTTIKKIPTPARSPRDHDESR